MIVLTVFSNDHSKSIRCIRVNITQKPQLSRHYVNNDPNIRSWLIKLKKKNIYMKNNNTDFMNMHHTRTRNASAASYMNILNESNE